MAQFIGTVVIVLMLSIVALVGLVLCVWIAKKLVSGFLPPLDIARCPGEDDEQ